MNIKKLFSFAVLAAVLAVLSSVSVSAQEMSKKMEDDRPIVAVISAEWCPYCKKVEPVVSELMKEYGEKLNFVVFDVTDDKAVKESMKKAEMLGLGDFFKNFKNKTSTVAVLKNKEVVFKTSNNGKREEYVKAFEKALE